MVFNVEVLQQPADLVWLFSCDLVILFEDRGATSPGSCSCGKKIKIKIKIKNVEVLKGRILTNRNFMLSASKIVRLKDTFVTYHITFKIDSK